MFKLIKKLNRQLEAVLFPLTGIMIIILITMVLFSLFYPFKPVILHEPITVPQVQVVAGESVDIHFDLEKNTNIKPQIQWFLIDGFIQELATSSVNRSTGDQEFESRKYIPAQTPPGIYHIRVEATYDINFLRKIHYSWDTNEFEVLAKE